MTTLTKDAFDFLRAQSLPRAPKSLDIALSSDLVHQDNNIAQARATLALCLRLARRAHRPDIVNAILNYAAWISWPLRQRPNDSWR